MVPQQHRVIVAGQYASTPLDPALIRSVRSKNVSIIDRSFLIIATLSIVIHFVFIFLVKVYVVPPQQATVIEEVPERFAKLIIEKPLPKTETTKKATEKTSETAKTAIEKTDSKPAPTGPVTTQQRTKARKSVDARVARVEQKIRTVGVLGMLTGVGTTAKGPSVVDVLGTLKDRKEHKVDLESALDKMTGLQKTKQVDLLDRKLVKSKDVAISHKEDIDDLLANVGGAKTVDLAKKGSFIIQKPQSIEGAASSNAKRDNDAISAIVSSHKTSIRMSYERYLKREPTLAGKITVRFTIAASGSVAMVTIVENTTGNTELEKEIMRKIRMWRFETITDGDVTVTYPFVFAPAG
ncbi:MAG: energy transducer TonB [Chitinispirillaceae bacterium]|nr:energy transducer TonB [Chitinispirillaceae bacterium]